MNRHDIAFGWRYLRNGGSITAPTMELFHRIYRWAFAVFVWPIAGFKRAWLSPWLCPRVEVKAERVLAINSPDFKEPIGARLDNSTNKAFVLKMDDLIHAKHKWHLDLGCAGGQLVADFLQLGSWTSIGIEGSDFPLRHPNRNWKRYLNTNLFNADITDWFQVRERSSNVEFDLITAWEVLEHIDERELDLVILSIFTHLKRGGYFIASTSDGPGPQHQTRWDNEQWRRFFARRWPSLEWVDFRTLGLKPWHMVRYCYSKPSILVFRKI